MLSASTLRRQASWRHQAGPPHLPRAPVPIRNFPETLTFQRPPSFPRLPAGLTPDSAGLIGPETSNLSALGGLARPRRHQLQGLSESGSFGAEQSGPNRLGTGLCQAGRLGWPDRGALPPAQDPASGQSPACLSVLDGLGHLHSGTSRLGWQPPPPAPEAPRTSDSSPSLYPSGQPAGAPTCPDPRLRLRGARLSCPRPPAGPQVSENLPSLHRGPGPGPWPPHLDHSDGTRGL